MPLVTGTADFDSRIHYRSSNPLASPLRHNGDSGPVDVDEV